MTSPLCPYFGSCGGCTSQNIEYQTQLDNKLKIVSRNIGLPEAEIKTFSDNPYSYRNRMDFIFHQRGLGLRRRGDWRSIVDVEKCAISNDKLNILLQEVRDFFHDVDSFDIRRKSGAFRYALIRTPSGSSSISFVLNENSMKIAQATERIQEYSKKSSADNIIITFVPKDTDNSISEDFYVVKGRDMLSENFLGRDFEYSVQGFFQNNTEMAQKMHEYVRSLVKSYGTSAMVLLDLYWGVGTFGINNADLFKKIIII